MQEVALGYTKEQARLEAMRCLQCEKAPCITGCPVGIDILGFIQAIVDEDYKKSLDILKESSLLPVYVEESALRKHNVKLPVLLDVNKSVVVGRLELFITHWERENRLITIPKIKPTTGQKVTVVGSGPAEP